MEDDSEQTFSEIIKSVRASSKKVQEEEKPSSKKHGKGKDISKLADVIRSQRGEKIALRPISRTKYFDLDSLKFKHGI